MGTNHLSIFSRGYYAELINEIILIFDHWLRCCSNRFLFLDLAFGSVLQKHLSFYVRGKCEENFCDIF